MNKYAIIVAGGSGTRMGTVVPKQFLLIQEKPVLYYTLQAFMTAYTDIKIILVLPEDYLGIGEAIIKKYFPNKEITIATGGATRFHSVKNGLNKINKESVVFVHDAVRCLVSPGLIQRCYDTAIEKGLAIPAIQPKDSIRQQTANSTQALDRNKLLLIQTPQTFRSDILLSAFEQDYTDTFTDEATVVEAMGHTLYFVAGDEQNIKITTPIDLMIAASILTEPM